MKKRILLLAVAVAGLLLAPSCRKTEVEEHFQIGEMLPDFSVTTTDGKKVTTSDLKGKPSIVIIFPTTCPDCTAQLPEVETVFAAHKEDINVLAVNRVGDDPACHYAGGSAVIDPVGRTVAECPQGEHPATADLSIEKLLDMRSHFRVLDDRDNA